ncbi:hypothetical protein [Actinoplanes sp. NPDC049265]|uniref:hypothetical protein n=1 Tax=Actinoplanes sp. NPDC049265 TaxID=3363902 RepID=UPI003711955B
MVDTLVLRLQPSWDPTWGEIQVSPAYRDELRAALDAADVPNSEVIKASAGETLACVGIFAGAAAPLFKALTPALKAFLSRHDNKRVEIQLGDETATMVGYSAKQVESILSKADEREEKRAAQQRELDGGHG